MTDIEISSYGTEVWVTRIQIEVEMHTEAPEHLVNLNKFENYPAKEAYLTIVVAAERAGYLAKPGSKGAIRHSKFYQGRSNPFALIANKNDMLFYIRQPALKLRPELAEVACKHFPTNVLATTNSLDETRIRIHNLSEAAKLADWLFPTA